VYKTLLIDTKDRIATVIINRPEKHNALNAEAKEELHNAFAGFKVDRDIDVIIVTGSGDKAFVAGTDIGELTLLTKHTGIEFAARGQELFNEIEQLGKPVIAAVNGYALGGGCELALACHVRLASDRAKFGQPEVNLGIIPGYGGTQRLARMVGKAKAAEMILTGVQVDAQEALRIGLVNRVVAHADLIAQATFMAKSIASMSQIAIHLALQALNATAETTLSEGLSVEARLFGEGCASEDFKEGTKAFLEKRRPAFKNA
jgi:enoyl-CoA hydratase